MDARPMSDTMGGSNESVGKALTRVREEKNLSLDEVSRATKIKKEFLIAIEEDRIEALPGQVFARGFIRAYADYLGVDGAAYALRAVQRVDPLPDAPGAKPAKKQGGGRTVAVALSALGGLAIAAAYLATHLHF